MSKEKLLASAQKFIEKGQIGKAIKDYQKIVETDPKDLRNRQKLAELLSRERMKDEALREYETVARTYSDTGFYLKAIAVYRQMQKLEPGRPEFYQRLAELSEKQGLIGDAQAEYRNLSACYEKSRMFSEQLKVLQKMRELEPENLNLRVKIVENLLLVDTAENARNELQTLLDDPAVAKDGARVAKLYDHFLPKFPDDLVLQAGHAESLVRKGEKHRGMQVLHDLLRKDPENAGVLRILARVYRHEGKFQEERLIYQRLLVYQADDLGCREAYLRAGIDAGETAAVRADLEKWQDDFANAGRSELVADLYSRLGGNAPAASGAEPAAAFAAEAAPGPDPFSADGEDGDEGTLLQLDDAEPIEELEEIAEVIEEVEELPEEAESPPVPSAAAGDPEEIPLDYLEEAPLDFLEETISQTPPATPGAPAPPAELELELEIDVDLDLDADLELAETADEPEAGAAFLELDLDDASPFGIDPGTAEKAVDDFAAPAAADAAADFSDLGADLADELDAVLPVAPAASAVDPPKKRVKTDVEVDDPESHYNLGIAYKEMGLLDDAIGEFDKGVSAPGRAVPCLILKSMCLVEKGDRQSAEATLRQGLSRADVNEEGRISLHFELGELYESGNKLKEAYEAFKYVADRDLFYREAGERVAALRQRLGLDGDEAAAAAGGRKNRVSYV